MPEIDETLSLETLEALVDGDKFGAAAEIVAASHAQDAADVLQNLEAADVAAILVLLNPDHAADILEDFPDDLAADVLEEIQPVQAAEIVTEIMSDEEADILQEVSVDHQAAIIEHLNTEQAQIARELLAYPEDTAGGMMQKEFIAVPIQLTATEARRTLQQMAEDEEEFYPYSYIYAVDDDGGFQGVLSLRALLFAQPNTPLTQLVIEDARYLSPELPSDEVVKLFKRTDLLSLPVVDATGRLLGLVSQEDAQEYAKEETEEEFLRFTGIMGGEEVREMPLRQRAGRRLLWLMMKMVLNVIPASVVAAYTNTPAFLLLAPILPIISDMGGSGGSQSIAVTIRELSLNRVRMSDYAWVMAKELGVGLINGVILGVLLGLGSYIATSGDPRSITLGLVVTVATTANLILAIVLGGLMPLVLRRLNVDPAAASGPLLTMITDTAGFFFVLALAALLIPS